MTVQTGINNISNEWFKPIIDKKVLKNLSKRSDYEGWKHGRKDEFLELE